jgi:DNA primase catalytic subunit
MSGSDERLPISEFYTVIDYVTIFKNAKWWEAIVVYESFGKRSIGFYLWEKKKEAWKRKNKFSFKTLEDWNKLKNAVDQLTPKLAQKPVQKEETEAKNPTSTT